MHVRRVVALCKHGLLPCPECPIKCVDCGQTEIVVLDGVGLFCVECTRAFLAKFRGL